MEKLKTEFQTYHESMSASPRQIPNLEYTGDWHSPPMARGQLLGPPLPVPPYHDNYTPFGSSQPQLSFNQSIANPTSGPFHSNYGQNIQPRLIELNKYDVEMGPRSIIESPAPSYTANNSEYPHCFSFEDDSMRVSFSFDFPLSVAKLITDNLRWLERRVLPLEGKYCFEAGYDVIPSQCVLGFPEQEYCFQGIPCAIIAHSYLRRG